MPSREGAHRWARRNALQALLTLPAGAAIGATPALAAGPARARAAASGAWDRPRRRGFTTDHLDKLTEPVLDALAATGANLARVGVRCIPDGAGYALQGLERLPAMAAHGQRRGVGLVLAGFFDEGQPQRLWADGASAQVSFIAQWRALAQVVQRHPAVLGLDLLNEPLPPDPARLDLAQRGWTALVRRAASAIRAAGCDRPLVIQPVQGGMPGGLEGQPDWGLPHAITSIHFYVPHVLTHQGVAPAWPRGAVYPSREALA
ncbi:MAG: cellulase family glycosylhydrolase, partial [Aquabacterium sp.]